MNYRHLSIVGWLGVASMSLACSAGRDVEVSGKVAAPSTVQVKGKLVVEFIDVMGEGDAAEKSVAHTLELEQFGEFNETVALEGDSVIVRAINDADGDGKCTAGEEWGEAEGAIDAEDKVAALTLNLSAAACPAE